MWFIFCRNESNFDLITYKAKKMTKALNWFYRKKGKMFYPTVWKIGPTAWISSDFTHKLHFILPECKNCSDMKMQKQWCRCGLRESK